MLLSQLFNIDKTWSFLGRHILDVTIVEITLRRPQFHQAFHTNLNFYKQNVLSFPNNMTFQQFESIHLQIRASRIPILKALLFSLFAPCIKFNITIYIGIQCLCYFVRKWGYSCRYKFLLKIIVLYQVPLTVFQ